MDNTPELTPIEKHGNIYVKRDDLFEIAGIRGGKVRSCWAIANSRKASGLITASARHSPQMQIVARLGQRLGLPCRLHTAWGKPTDEMEDAALSGGMLVQHKPGYNSVIIKRAEDEAKEKPNWIYVPFGMECKEAITQTRKQVKSIYEYCPSASRIVITIGSGMSAAGVLWGLHDYGLDIPVLGIQIGARPNARLDRYAPPMWRTRMKIVLSKHPYHEPVKGTFDGIVLDPHYEAKCLEYLKASDVFWIVGIRAGLEEQF